jgi:hypothetical protein
MGETGIGKRREMERVQGVDWKGLLGTESNNNNNPSSPRSRSWMNTKLCERERERDRAKKEKFSLWSCIIRLIIIGNFISISSQYSTQYFHFKMKDQVFVPYGMRPFSPPSFFPPHSTHPSPILLLPLLLNHLFK